MLKALIIGILALSGNAQQMSQEASSQALIRPSSDVIYACAQLENTCLEQPDPLLTELVDGLNGASSLYSFKNSRAHMTLNAMGISSYQESVLLGKIKRCNKAFNACVHNKK